MGWKKGKDTPVVCLKKKEKKKSVSHMPDSDGGIVAHSKHCALTVQ